MINNKLIGLFILIHVLALVFRSQFQRHEVHLLPRNNDLPIHGWCLAV